MLVDVASRFISRSNGPRVAVVGNSEVARRGFMAILTETPGLGSVITASHDAACAWHDEWSDVDVVLVDAVDERRRDDQFPGVPVVERIRSVTAGRAPAIIVITPHYYDDALRRRMREAKANGFYHRDELADKASLLADVLRPGHGDLGHPVPGPTDLESQFRCGIGERSRVNRGVRFALRNDLPKLLLDRTAPRSRAWLRLREEFNDEARLYPVTADGRTPERATGLPSLPQIGRFLDWATRTKPLPTASASLSAPWALAS